MGDLGFEQYLEFRNDVEKDLRRRLGAWAMGDAPSDMKVGEFRALADQMVAMMNERTREAFDLGRAVNNET